MSDNAFKKSDTREIINKNIANVTMNNKKNYEV